MSTTLQPKKIAICVESSRSFGRGLIEGISQYAREQGDWLLYYHESTLDTDLPGWLNQNKWNGIITRITRPQDAETIALSGIPAVDLLGEVLHPKIPSVDVDHKAVSKLAIEFFLQAGFSQVAYCGYHGVHFSDARFKAFEQVAKDCGMAVQTYTTPISASRSIIDSESWRVNRDVDLSTWLKSLPTPTAILACNDVRALDVSSACRLNGIRVPEEISILGVDDDELICQMGHPAISSIAPDLIRHGYRGAEILQQCLTSSSHEILHESIPPKFVVERPSTDQMVFNKDHVMKAIRYMRKHYREHITSEHIAAEIGVSRSLLDRDFKSELRRTVSQELARIRLVQIKRLLSHTSLTLSDIAQQTGFMNASTLSLFFKAQTKQTPGQYREG